MIDREAILDMCYHGSFNRALTAFSVGSTYVVKDHIDAYLALKSLLYTGQFEDCWKHLEEYTNMFGALPEFNIFYGMKEYHAGNHQLALERATNVVDLHSQSITFVYADAMHLQAICLRRLGQVDKALSIVEQEASIRNVLGDRFGYATSMTTKSSILIAMAKYHEAAHSSQLAAQSFALLRLPLRKQSAIHNLVLCYLKMGLLVKADQLATEFDREKCDIVSSIRSLILLARIDTALSNYKTAHSHAQYALSLTSKHPREHALTLETLGDIAAAQEKYDEARDYYRQALEIGERIAPEGDIVAEVHRRLASLHVREKDYIGAVHLLKDAIKRAEKCGERFEIGIAHRELSVCYLALDQHVRAIEEARVSAQQFKEMGSPIEQARSLVQLAESSLAWHHYLATHADVAVHQQDDSPYTHLEYAWTSTIEAYHLFDELDRPQDVARCEALMDRMRREATPLWLNQHPLRRKARSRRREEPFIAESPAMQQVLVLVELAGAATEPVLVTGETGTGKELIARMIHRHSPRADRPFVAVNCAAIPETLFEREFFGHRKGAFTGADTDQPGYCEAADGGTLFLDEIGEMPLSLQVKLLRLLQEGTFRRLGEAKERRVDLRIIAATNAPLHEMIAAGRFRRDLYYRLQTLEITLPPLRERTEDLRPLVELFAGRELGPDADLDELFSPDVFEALETYFWPGNVRELESTVRRLALLARHSGRVTAAVLPESLKQSLRLHRAREEHLDEFLEEVERERIQAALAAAGGSRSEAARALGISRSSLYRRMERLGIRIPA